MEETLLGRMLPYIDTAAATIARGKLLGLCWATQDAWLDGVISVAERGDIYWCIHHYVQQHDCGFVCVHLTPLESLWWHRDSDTCVLAAERWREWAISLVRDVQRELYEY